jgi:hypothetical protein
MKKVSTVVAVIILVANSQFVYSNTSEITFEVNVLNYQDDLFHVMVYSIGLSE